MLSRFSATPALLAAGAALALAAPASAAVVTGSIKDARGGKHPGADIRGVAMSYDSAGSMTGVVATQAAPVEPAVAGFSFLAGTASKRRGVCVTDFEQMIYTAKAVDEIPPGGPGYGNGSDLGELDGQQSGLFLRFTTVTGNEESGPRGNDPRIANRPWNCAVVESRGPGTHREGKRKDVYDLTDVSRVFPLVAGPAANCVIAPRTSRGRVRIRCVNVAGKVTVRIHRKQKPRAVRSATVRDGSLSVSARGLRRRAEYGVSVWQGPTMFAASGVRRR